jgi:predicted nucleic acid-binding protein
VIASQTDVLDAWRILEWLLGKQPAAHKFSLFLNAREQLGTRLLITRLDRGEILYTLAKRVSVDSQRDAEESLERLQLEVVSIEDNLVDSATTLKKQFACSYADCFAAALAMRERAPLVTGDPELLKLSDKGLFALEWLGA